MSRSQAKVLVVTNMFPSEDDPSSGIFVKETVDVTRASGLDVDVLFIKGRRTPFKYLLGVFRLWGRLLRSKYDLIHAYYVYSGFVARAQLTCPVVVTLCGSDVNLSSQRGFSKLLSRAVYLTVVRTKRMKQLLGTEHAVVIPSGVNLSVFEEIPREVAKTRLGLDSITRFILFPYDPRRRGKRFELFLAALKIVQGHESTLKHLILKDLPRELVPLYMSAADVMVLTSESEGSPNTIKEALACGLPIVSVDVGDVAELVEGVDGCWICEPNEHALAEGILKALSFEGRTNGRDRAKELSSEVMIQKLLNLYAEVLEKKGAGAR